MYIPNNGLTWFQSAAGFRPSTYYTDLRVGSTWSAFVNSGTPPPDLLSHLLSNQSTGCLVFWDIHFGALSTLRQPNIHSLHPGAACSLEHISFGCLETDFPTVARLISLVSKKWTLAFSRVFQSHGLSVLPCASAVVAKRVIFKLQPTLGTTHPQVNDLTS